MIKTTREVQTVAMPRGLSVLRVFIFALIVLPLGFQDVGSTVDDTEEVLSSRFVVRSDEFGVRAEISEDGGEQLGLLMNQFGAEDRLQVRSLSGDVQIDCQRIEPDHRCVFRFQASGRVAVEGQTVFALSDDEDSLDLRVRDFVHLRFRNPAGERFRLFLDQHQVMAILN